MAGVGPGTQAALSACIQRYNSAHPQVQALYKTNTDKETELLAQDLEKMENKTGDRLMAANARQAKPASAGRGGKLDTSI